MIEEAAIILEGLGERAPVRVRRATFVEVTEQGSARVDMGSSRFIAEFGGGYIPSAGETVNIVSVGERHLLLPGRPLPGTGTILTVSGNLANVQTVIGAYSMPYVGTAPSSGDLVGISWSEVPYVVGKLSVQPDAPAPPPDPGSGAVRSATFKVTDTGSTDRTQARWWTGRPQAGNTSYGAWFYGTQIRDTIPSGATLVKLEFFVSYIQRQGSAPRFTLHDRASKGSLPTFGAYTEWAPGGGWQSPPMASAWFNALKSGGGQYGIGLNQGGWNIFSSRTDNSMSGALRISWRP
ncbi:hypothetical protein FGL91_18635 [Microbacterium sp. CBA3102]|uniref:hypothetical protein n=1 Tax=Microbacterium sp. CBA3102 TaxID=2603598 RepID=UPI0011BB556B|nr:hypothetical protein [Microbacterium sp. CBA3102]QEA30386.1 hypothetical protein FGL91_18635 [Microbacterium sp. CBA3102]